MSSEGRQIIEVSNPGNLAVSIPYLIGYRPSDEHVVIAAVANDRVIVVASAQWVPAYDQLDSEGSRPDLKGRLVNITDVLEPAVPDSYLILGYGPQGRDRAILVGAHLEDLTGQPTTSMAVEPDGSVGVFNPERYGWDLYQGDAGRLEAELAYAGIPRPAPTRQAHVAKFAPYPEPTWEALPLAEQLRVEQALPSERAAEGVELLSAMQGAGDRDPGRLAYLMRSNREVRDEVIIAGIQTNAASTLLELYRGAPSEYRDVTGAVAAVVMFTEFGGGLGVEEVLGHVSPTSDQAALSELMDGVLKSGMPPSGLREVLTAGDHTVALKAADSRFLIDRTHQALSHAKDSLATPGPKVAPRPDLPPKAPVQHGPALW